MPHIEITGTPGTLAYEVWGALPERCLAIIPGQHSPELAGYLARELCQAAEKWESYAALKGKASIGTGCPTVERISEEG